MKKMKLVGAVLLGIAFASFSMLSSAEEGKRVGPTLPIHQKPKLHTVLDSDEVMTLKIKLKDWSSASCAVLFERDRREKCEAANDEAAHARRLAA